LIESPTTSLPLKKKEENRRIRRKTKTKKKERGRKPRGEGERKKDPLVHCERKDRLMTGRKKNTSKAR